jgi:plasmid stability protein
MAQLLLHNLDDGVTERLRQRAQEHGRSLEEEARVILDEAARPAKSEDQQHGLGSRIAARFAGIGLTEEEAASFELRGEQVRPAEFD